MTAYGGNGALVNSTTAPSPSYPASIPAGSLLLAVVGWSELNNTPPTTPSGWSRLVMMTAGAGTYGVDAGPRNVAVYRKNIDALGSETGTVVFTLGGSTVGRAASAVIAYVPKGIAGSTWDVQAFTGQDVTSDTAFSALLTALTPGTQSRAGDLLFGATATIPTASTLGTRTLTWGTITGTNSIAAQPQSISYTSGNSVRTSTFSLTHASGVNPTTGSPTYAAVGSGAVSGAVAMLRIHEVASNQAPTIGVTTDFGSVASGDVAHLTATVTDNDGTVVSEAWSHNAPAGNVVGAGRTRTFTAPYVRANTTYTFTYTATDDGGTTSQNSATITVAAHKRWVARDDGTVVPAHHVTDGGDDPTQTDPVVDFTLADGDGMTTMTWSVIPNGSSPDGIYIGRDGVSSTGGGAYETYSAVAGLSGVRTLNNLVNGSVYNVYVVPVVAGTRREDLRVTHQSRPVAAGGGGGGGGGGLPTYTGFTLRTTVDLSQNGAWWDWQTGKEHISAGYCGSTGTEHVAFDSVNGCQIKMRKRSSPITVGGYALPFDTAEGYLNGTTSVQLPNYFRARAVWSMTAFHVGLFPAFAWFRPYPSGSGEGEIDWWESFGGHLSNTQAVNKTTLISTPYSGSTNQNYVVRVEPSLVGETDTSLIVEDHVYEFEKIPNRIRTWIDGVPITEHTRGGTNGFGGQNMTTANWDRCFEVSTQRWYMRYTGQIGDDPDGTPKGNAGTVPSDFVGSDMRLKQLSFWNYNG